MNEFWGIIGRSLILGGLGALAICFLVNFIASLIRQKNADKLKKIFETHASKEATSFSEFLGPKF